MCVDQNKATSPHPAKGNFDDYRFDLTKLTPLTKISQVHTIMLHLPPTPWPKFHRCIPSCYTYPLAKISWIHTITLQLPPKPKFHRCIPSCYTYPPPGLKFHRCIPLRYTYTPPTGQNFMDAFHHITPTRHNARHNADKHSCRYFDMKRVKLISN